MSGGGFVSLRGYAVPFRQAARCAGRLEYFAPQAFDAMLARGHSAFLNFEDHDAPSICRPLTLFADSYGLGFSASISAENWRGIAYDITKRNTQFASVFTTGEKVTHVRLEDGTISARIDQATIEHVTLTHSPVYKGTGVWPADVVGEMPPRLAQLAARWESGWRRSRENRFRGNSLEQLAKASLPGLTGERKLSAHLAPRLAHYAAVRRDFARGLIAGKEPIGVWAHVAFTRAAGFDGDFQALAAAERRRMYGSR